MEFVSFEIAKKLKEKGYPQVKKNTIAMYNEVGNWYSLAQNLDDFEYSFEDFDEHDYVCPTISQVLKWLREEKELYIEIYMYHNCYLWEIYNTKIYDTDFTQKSEKYSEIEYETPEQATLAGIEYVLDNLIMKRRE